MRVTSNNFLKQTKMEEVTISMIESHFNKPAAKIEPTTSQMVSADKVLLEAEECVILLPTILRMAIREVLTIWETRETVCSVLHVHEKNIWYSVVYWKRFTKGHDVWKPRMHYQWGLFQKNRSDGSHWNKEAGGGQHKQSKKKLRYLRLASINRQYKSCRTESSWARKHIFQNAVD